MLKQFFIALAMFLSMGGVRAQGMILIPMDETQTNHLKAYGVAYHALVLQQDLYWLLNYRGGSFAIIYNEIFAKECKIKDISFERLPTAKFNAIQSEIMSPEVNMDVLKLEKAPKVAVYTPTKNEKGEDIQPWDDAVTLALTYAEIPYDIIYDNEVMRDKLTEYDWLHLHHEDFTGQYGRFYAQYSSYAWYKEYVRDQTALAKNNGFTKVSQLKLAVATKIREWVVGGGFMFAMCSATDSYDIALAAHNTDICDVMYDGDGPDPNFQSKLDYSQTFAFKDFTVIRDPMQYEFSDIDASPVTMPLRNIDEKMDYFSLFDFSAKYDPVPTILTQCQTRTVKGFMGQTTAFRKKFLKSSVLVLGENKAGDEARYIHGEYGQGTWTFYGGHDPEDYRHFVGDPPTDLKLHPNSEGFRLILNNILFPAAKKKKQKT